MSTDSMQSGVVSLSQLAPRVCATVRALTTEDEDIQRLKTLGFCVGRQVEVIKQGDPLIVRIFGSRLGLSSRLASLIQVEPCATGCFCLVAGNKPPS